MCTMNQIMKKVLTLFFYHMTNSKRQYHCIERVGQGHIELAEREVLEETLIDDEENDDGITNDNDQEFDTQLELAGEIRYW